MYPTIGSVSNSHMTTRYQKGFITNQKGFTYLEIVIAFAIFGLMLVVAFHLSDTTYTVAQRNQVVLEMRHLAFLELENYKTGIMNPYGFADQTGFRLVHEAVATNGTGIDRVLEAQYVAGRFGVTIEEYSDSDSSSEVKVTVNDDRSGESVFVVGQMFK